MPPAIASAFFAIGILGLFMLDRDREAKTSKALWIPVLWLLINGSRPVSMWLQLAPTMDTPDQYLDGSPFDRAVYLILLIAGFIVLIRRGRKVGTILRANTPIIIFFLFCFASIFWSDYTFVAFKRWTKAVGDLVMVLIVFTDLDPEAALKRLLTRVGFVLLPLSVLVIRYYPEMGRSFNQWSWTYMYNGISTTKNMLGMTCLIAGLGSVWQLTTAYRDREDIYRRRHLIAHASLIAMALWLFWTANSMTSLACFLMAGSIIVITSLRFARRPIAAQLLMAGAIGLSLAALFFDSGGGMVQSLGRDATLTGRTAIWKAVISLVENPVGGTGFESFWLGDRLRKVWDMTDKGIQEAHNGYLEVYLNLGWLGISLLALLLVTGYRNVIALFRYNPEAGSIRVAFFATAIIYNLTEAGFRMMSMVWIAFLLAIVAVPELLPKETPYEEPLLTGPLHSQVAIDPRIPVARRLGQSTSSLGTPRLTR